jgi:hypothetical protein
LEQYLILGKSFNLLDSFGFYRIKNVELKLGKQQDLLSKFGNHNNW